MSFFKPKIPKAQKPPAVPQIDDAQREADLADIARRRQGRAATILGGASDTAPNVTRASILG